MCRNSRSMVTWVVLFAVVAASCVAQTGAEVLISVNPFDRPSTQSWLIQSQIRHLVLEGGYEGPLVGLDQLTKLESVTITFSDVSDWAALPTLPSVERVTVSKAQLPGFDSLYVFPNLRQLVVINSVVIGTRQRLDLSRLPNLVFADLSFSLVEWVPQLVNVASGSLAYLNLEGSRIVAGSTEAIDALRSVPMVSLARNPIMESESIEVPQRFGIEIRDIPDEFRAYYNLRELYPPEEMARISESNAREP